MMMIPKKTKSRSNKNIGKIQSKKQEEELAKIALEKDVDLWTKDVDDPKINPIKI